MTNEAPLSGSPCRDPEHRSKKDCVCGGHSQRDHKKNLHHSGTLRRLWHRLGRLLKRKEQE